jgi:hypothetical protein
MKVPTEAGIHPILLEEFHCLLPVLLGHGKVRVWKNRIIEPATAIVPFRGEGGADIWGKVVKVFLVGIEKPRMMTKDVNLRGFVSVGVFQSVLQPFKLLGEHILSSFRVDKENVVEGDIVSSIDPKGKVFIPERVSKLFNRLRGRTITYIVVSTKTHGGNIRMKVGKHLFEIIKLFLLYSLAIF